MSSLLFTLVIMSQLKMHQPIADYTFNGPYVNLKRIPEVEGIYAVTCSDLKRHYLLDLGYSRNVRKSFSTNARRGCWEKHKLGRIMYAYLHIAEIGKAGYISIAREIRKKYPKIPCGE